MAVRKSNRATLRILASEMFAFGALGPFEIIEGGMESHVFSPESRGVPEVTNTQLNSIAITFYSAAMGGNIIGGNTIIVNDARSDIVSVSYEPATDMITLEFDAQNVSFADSDGSQQNVYFELSVVQNDV